MKKNIRFATVLAILACAVAGFSSCEDELSEESVDLRVVSTTGADTLWFYKSAPNNRSLKVNSNAEWEATTTADWLVLNRVGNEVQLFVHAMPTDEVYDRYATVVITSGEAQRSFVVAQVTDPSYTLSWPFKVNHEWDTLNPVQLNVNSTARYQMDVQVAPDATGSKDWFAIQNNVLNYARAERNESDRTLTMHFDTNHTDSLRSVNLRFTDSRFADKNEYLWLSTKNVTFYQTKGNLILSNICDTIANWDVADNDKYTYTQKKGATYKLAEYSSWVTSKTTTDDNKQKVWEFTAKANSSGIRRNGYVVIEKKYLQDGVEHLHYDLILVTQ